MAKKLPKAGSIKPSRWYIQQMKPQTLAWTTLHSRLTYGCGGMGLYYGMNMYYCGGIYYRPVHQGTTVVYVVERVDPGANQNVQIQEYY